MEATLALARQEHRASLEATDLARQHRTNRDRLIRRAVDEGVSYRQIARAIGMSKDAVAKVIAEGRGMDVGKVHLHLFSNETSDEDVVRLIQEAEEPREP